MMISVKKHMEDYFDALAMVTLDTYLVNEFEDSQCGMEYHFEYIKKYEQHREMDYSNLPIMRW
jgi:hypothetical protein